jgi:hypothetical protein
MSGHARKWIGGIVAVSTVLGLSPRTAEANIVTYRFVNASASFITDQFSAPGASSFTLNINGTFSYDLINLVATAVDVTLSGPIPPIISQFEAYPYTDDILVAGGGFSGFPPRAFTAQNSPFDDQLTVGFEDPFSNAADRVNAFDMTSPAYGSFTEIAVTGMIVRIPEPASIAVFGTALVGFGVMRRRRKFGVRKADKRSHETKDN